MLRLELHHTRRHLVAASMRLSCLWVTQIGALSSERPNEQLQVLGSERFWFGCNGSMQTGP
jgi:hypothetical protein